MSSEQRSAFLLIVDPHFVEDLKYWAETDPKVSVKVLTLIEHISRDPFKGLGKPELLKGIVLESQNHAGASNRLPSRLRQNLSPAMSIPLRGVSPRAGR